VTAPSAAHARSAPAAAAALAMGTGLAVAVGLLRSPVCSVAAIAVAWTAAFAAIVVGVRFWPRGPLADLAAPPPPLAAIAAP
jgi:hypothetical protein